jgi:5-methylcytosine-specific restriction protein A
MATTEEFRAEMAAQIQRAVKQRRPHLEINAGELHRAVGGYEARECGIVFETASGNAAALTVRYNLPR